MELNQKQNLLKELLEDSMTKSEVLEIAKKLAEHVKVIEERTAKDVAHIHRTLSGVVESIKERADGVVSNLKQEVKDLVAGELERASGEHSTRISEINDKMSKVKDGKDADEKLIAEMVCDMIKIPTIEELKNDLPVMSEQIRNALELLQGDDRLDVSAIKGIEELLSTIKGGKSLGGGGGFSKLAFERYVIDDETPSGDINGVNTDFELSRTPTGNSLKVYLGGTRQRVNVDFTLAGRTISFLTLAPEAGQVLLADYRA